MKNRALLAALVALVCVLVWVNVPPGAQDATAGVRQLGPLADPEHECPEPIPESVSAPGITDSGQTIKLDVLVLLDGITRSRGRAVLKTMSESYEPLAVAVTPRFQKVRFPHDGVVTIDENRGPEETGDAVPLIQQAKDLLGGARPRGSDVVLLLTAKNIFLEGLEREYSIAGMADCIGGVRFPDHAFAVSEGASPWEEMRDDELLSGKIAAHEVGHLMGAHHHYANCGEGDQHPAGSDSYCTVMFPAQLQFMARNFGTLEAAVVRGHAVDFAAP